MRLTHHPQPAQMPRASEGTERAPSQLPARGPSQRRRNRPESLSPPATPQPPRVGSSSARSALARIAARLIYLGGLTRADLAQISSPPREGTERAPSQLLGRPTRNTRRSRADLVTATRGYRASAVAASSRQRRAAPSSVSPEQRRFGSRAPSPPWRMRHHLFALSTTVSLAGVEL